MKKNGKLLIALIFGLFAAWFYAAPYLTLQAIKSAANARDADKLSGYINFPLLRASIKEQYSALMQDSMRDKRDNPLAVLGSSLALALADKVVDTVVRPEGLARLMSGEKIHGNREGDNPTTPRPQDETEITTGYAAFDQFEMRIRKKHATDKPLVLVLKRENLFFWKLAGMKLPV